MGKTPTDSSGNITNEFNQVSPPIEEAIKIKGAHTSTVLSSSAATASVCQQLECILHTILPLSKSGLYRELHEELPLRTVSSLQSRGNVVDAHSEPELGVGQFH